jgi:hypothetical protein
MDEKARSEEVWLRREDDDLGIDDARRDCLDDIDEANRIDWERRRALHLEGSMAAQ